MISCCSIDDGPALELPAAGQGKHFRGIRTGGSDLASKDSAALPGTASNHSFDIPLLLLNIAETIWTQSVTTLQHANELFDH